MLFNSFTDVLVAVTMRIYEKVSFSIECLKNFLPFSSIPFAISGAQLKEAQVIKKVINFDAGNYLNM